MAERSDSTGEALLAEIGRSLLSATPRTLAEALERSMSRVASEIGADSAAFVPVSDRHPARRAITWSAAGTPPIEASHLEALGAIHPWLGERLAHGGSLWVPEVDVLADAPAEREMFRGLGARSMLWLAPPAGALRAWLTFLWRERSASPADVDRVPVRAVAELLWAGLERLEGSGDDERAEHERAELERALFLGSVAGFYRASAKGELAVVNPALVRLLGYDSAEELLRVDFDKAVFFEVAQREGLRASLEHLGRVEGMRVQWRKRGGERLTVSLYARALRDSEGRLAGHEGMVIDLTESVRAGRALARAERELLEILERAPLGMVIRRGPLIAYANAAFAAAVGVAEPRQLVGRAAVELIHPEDRARALERMSKLDLSSRLLDPAEYRFIRADGSVAYGMLFVLAQVHVDGAPAFVLGLVDLTERRRMIDQLKSSDRLASVGTLAAGVAHEINNPLTFLMANLDMAISELGAGGFDSSRAPEIASALREGREGAERVRRITNDLRTFARSRDQQKRPCDVRAILDSTLRLASGELKQKAQVIREYHGVPLVQAVESGLAQVFLNLIVNASQALSGPGTGELRVVTRAGPGPTAIVEIHDNGAGIAPHHLPRLFDPFFTTKEVGVGTGLGLSVCHGIVTAHGGKIEVESAVGQGSMFRVILPAMG
ncbi:MAG: PAS domain S-box protein [Deltaproteobacteria bacterium]|nr:PAS domain S-box protein [Deltaproteobacteria bacterium]